MCNFLSITSDGKGNIKYFDWNLRKKCLSGELNFVPDSHTSVNSFYGYKGAEEDSRNKYEFNPLTNVFTIDMINTADDSREVERMVRSLDFKTIVEPLVVKPIINPFKMKKADKVLDEHIEKLKKWASMGESVGKSVCESVGKSVCESVWKSVWDSVWESVGECVWNSVWDSVWDSVGECVWAYISSFFLIEKWDYIEHEPFQNPYQPLIDLWEAGFVPSSDGELWRLYSGEKADIVGTYKLPPAM